MEREAVLNKITLKNVGFDLRQTADYHAGLLQRGASLKGRVEEAARDLSSYESESLEDNVFSFYPYYIREFEGRRRIFSADEPKPEFLAISQIDPRERDGAVLEGFKKVEDKLPQKGFVGWVSLDGEAGIHDIKYRYHQLYLANVDNNSMQAVALKSDIDAPILSEWLTRVSKGEIVLSDLSPRSFITSPVVLESEKNGVQSSLRILKEILARHNTDRFYKDISIDEVIMKMEPEKARQSEKVQNFFQELLPYFEMHGQDPKSLTEVLGGQLYNLYNKYRDSRGNITLTGCGGGTKCVNELFSEKTFGSGIFSTSFRIPEFATKTRNYKFDKEGTCRTCGSEAMCGPVGICEKCNDKIDSGELAA